MNSASRYILYALFLTSGATGLVYELVWTRQLILVFGGTTYAITTVLVAFMGGLGLGSYVAGRLTRGLQQPGRLYGILEILIGGYAFAVPLLLGLAEPMYRAAYPHVTQTPVALTALRFGVGCLVLLLPASLMGATLPILVRYATMMGGGFGKHIAILYGINSLGAVAGTLIAGFVAIPALGLSTVTTVTACVNIVIGLIAMATLGVRREAAGGAPAMEKASTGEQIDPGLRRLVLAVFALSGFAAMVYQIMWTRSLVLSLGSSTYSFTCILAAFILGIALGSFAVARRVDQWRNPAHVFGVVQLLIGLSAVLIVPVYGWIPWVVQAMVSMLARSYDALLAAQFLMIIVVTFIPTFLMGVAFPLVTRLVAAGAADAAAATGRAYAINTIGTITGSFLAGFVLIRSEVLGAQYSIILAALLNAAAGALLVTLSGRGEEAGWGPRLRAWGAVVAVPVLALLAGRWDPAIITSGPYLLGKDPKQFAETYDIIYFADGVDLTVSVAKDKTTPDSISLQVNGKPDASTYAQDMPTQLMIGHLGALFAPKSENAVIIGLGSGITVGAVAAHPEFKSIECAEISQEVIEAARRFQPYNHDVIDGNPKVKMVYADGRNHLLLTDQRYDVIISEPSNPWMTGVSNLFTQEFFQLIRDRLNENGVAGLWCHGYSMGYEDFRMVVRTLCSVFDYVSVWDAAENDYFFLASTSPLQFPLEEYLRRFEQPAVRADLYRAALGTPDRLLGRFIADEGPLRAWAGEGPIHTDDNALLEFSAPRYLYGGEPDKINKAIASLTGSVFDRLLVAPPGDPQRRALEEKLRTATQVRRLIADAVVEERAAYRNEGSFAEAFKHLLAAYELDPGNLRAYIDMIELRDRAVQLAGSETRIDPIFAALDDLQEPTLALITAKTPADVSNRIVQMAKQAAGLGRWRHVISYMTEAYSLTPDNADVILLLAAGYARDLRSREAIDLLESAIAAGTFDRAKLRDPFLEPLRDNPRFRALLGSAAANPVGVP